MLTLILLIFLFVAKNTIKELFSLQIIKLLVEHPQTRQIILITISTDMLMIKTQKSASLSLK